MSYCEEINCCYYYKEDWEPFPSCHFMGWWWWEAPCEENDDMRIDNYEEEE